MLLQDLGWVLLFNIYAGLDLKEARNSFGSSSEFIKSLRQIEKPNSAMDREISSVLLKEAHYLASCTYEKGTKWGQKARFSNLIFFLSNHNS